MHKALSMMGFGVYVLGYALWSFWHDAAPEPVTMGVVVAALAPVVNVAVAVVVAWMLHAFCEGNANMCRVWPCSRNDAVGILAVLLAALGVGGTARAWRDLLVASLMAGLVLQGGWSVLCLAHAELRGEPATSH